MSRTPIYAFRVLNETKAGDDLADAGFECWNLTFKAYRPGASWQLRNVNGRARHAMRLPTEVRRPVFPGYVFARIPAGGFESALESPRVVDVVRDGLGAPKPLPDDLIGDLIRRIYVEFEFDEAVAAPSRRKARQAVVPLNRARTRRKRRTATARLRKWLDDAETPHLARAA